MRIGIPGVTEKLSCVISQPIGYGSHLINDAG